MRKILFVLASVCLSFIADGQLIKKFNDKLKEKADQKAEQAIDKAAQKVIDTPEDVAKKKKEEKPVEPFQKQNEQIQPQSQPQQQPEINYGSFDFIPGDSILFEDEFINERINEIPSLWQLSEGKAEMVSLEGKNVLAFLNKGSIYPRMKKYNYLPKRFTVEFDFLNKEFSGKSVEEASGSGPGKLDIKFYSNEDYDKATGLFKEEWLNISNYGEMIMGDFKGSYENATRKKETDLFNKWVHVSIAVTETNLKAYINSTRILNASVKSGSRAPSVQIAGYTENWEGGNMILIRNVRIAGGLRDPYKQGTTEIKKVFIARGIKFDYNKATIKPESMGELNNVVAMLKDHMETKYEIGGHTDSDGDNAYNTTLSEQRAEAVKSKLIAMGIDVSRLTSKGYGKAKPIADNNTPEGKANNRRVEFTLTK